MSDIPVGNGKGKIRSLKARVSATSVCTIDILYLGMNAYVCTYVVCSTHSSMWYYCIIHLR